ncbi:hypothetical protein ACTRXD_08570, partial [Nitrospira sp. T9]|uniref:hypothetical protein n=1 Tax=unclassified Nitrospira TaxID=2652172 RepID=UPI003F9B4697
AQGVKARTLLDETLLFKTRKDPLAKHSFSESSDGIASPSQDPPGIHVISSMEPSWQASLRFQELKTFTPTTFYN